MKKTLPHRKDVAQQNKWNIEDFYTTNQEFEDTFSSFRNQISELDKFKNKLGASSKDLLDCLNLNLELSKTLDQLYTYANMRLHEDSNDSSAQTISMRSKTLLTEYSTATAFITPEILSIPEDTLQSYLKEDKFQEFAHYFHSLLRQKAHTLSEKEEFLLAQASDISRSPQNIFTMLNDADITFPTIKDDNNEDVELTKGRYVTFLESPNQEVRKNAFKALYETYNKQKNTLATIYYSSVKSDVFYSKARNYNSAREQALADDNIPLSVYDNLIETVHKNLPLLHRYIAIRKKELNLDELHMYDLYAPLVPEVDIKISYEEAKIKVRDSLKILGSSYIEALDKGFDEGWIDVYENKGKRGGAYSWGSYGVHPFVLLNHNDTINSMFTLAHEMGHALHSYFTWEKQSYLYSGHKIFVAEVASTCNEALLMDYLLDNTNDAKTRKYLINYFLEQFRGTLFRQTMFAEFEKITHEMVENGEPLTCEILNKIYSDLNHQYFGNDVIIDEDIHLEWARIPHFYNAFYVYQYATGYSSAIALANKIQTEGEPAIKDYLNFLSKGDSEYSIDLLKGAGVDLSTPAPIEQAMNLFEKLLDEMEKL